MRVRDFGRSGEVWECPLFHKTEKRGHDRVVLLGPACQAALAPWLSEGDPDAFLWSPKKAEEERHARRSLARRTPRWRSHVQRNTNQRVGKRKRPLGERSPPRRSRRQSGWGSSVPTERNGRKSTRRTVGWWCPRASASFPTGTATNRATPARPDSRGRRGWIVLGHTTADMTAVYAERDLLSASEAMRRIGYHYRAANRLSRRGLFRRDCLAWAFLAWW
jgi:hypothetical protein